ncbi:terminase large subunit [Oenococcus sicerae]|uniref:Terminase large subunit n=1 Tax=Oenococcus sicerae TaxID=2203724 RepID=A0AAJ1R891_9LACO|nr:terminase TerL endonuclease subunit [Oenococcus sicerae]MDN6899567.1 terminase large subunit [Oenococcus sicerae]
MKIDLVTKYAKDVTSGKQIAGKLIKLACQRHLDDLNRQDQPDFPYQFETKYVDGLLIFASLVPDPDAKVPLPLMPWQIFILGSLVGWRNVNTKGRRFRNGIVSMGRGQGKTYLASVLACYSFFVESRNKGNQDIILSANTTDQTKKLFNYTKGTVEQLLVGTFADLSKEITPRFMDIFNNRTKNQIVRISAEGGKFDGYHISTAIFDEAGDQKDREAFNKITSGMVKNKNALFLMISTAYPDPNAPLRDDIEMLKNVISNNERKLDDYFLAVFSQDDKNEVFKPETWVKSNPLLDLKNTNEELMSGLLSERDTKMSQGKLNAFLVKNMNLWLNAKQDAAFNLDEYKATTVTDFNFSHRDVYIGFDNSMTSDDGAFGFIFPYVPKKFFIYQHSFVPWHKAGSIEAKESQDGINYRHMQELGFASITKHKKGLISQDQEYEWLMDFVSEHDLNVLGFLYDKFHNSALIQSIADNTNWPMIPVRQGAISLNAPTKFLQDSFVDGRVTHLDDPMMEASLMNAVIVTDGNNGIKIDKQRATLKIDLVDAIVDGFYQGMYHFEDFANKDDPEAEFARMTDKQKHDFLMEDFSF